MSDIPTRKKIKKKKKVHLEGGVHLEGPAPVYLKFGSFDFSDLIYFDSL